MTTPENPPGWRPDDSEWAAYEPTQVSVPRPDLVKRDMPRGPGYAPADYGQAQFVQPPLPPAVPFPYGAPHPYPGQQQAAAPPTGQVSAIVALVFGGILTVSCYGTLIGIAPLVLGIIGLTKANSVSQLWITGQTTEAVKAAESSKTAAMWAWISLGIGVVLVVIAVIVFIVWVANTADIPETDSPYRTYSA